MKTLIRSKYASAIRIIAPTGHSKFAHWFLAGRVLAAAVSAGAALAAFAIAGAARVGEYASIVAIGAFAGSVAGGWLAQSLLRYNQVGSRSVMRVLYWTSWPSWALCGSVLLLGGGVAVAVPSSSDPRSLRTGLLVLLFSAEFATVTAMQGRARARFDSLGTVLLAIGGSAALTVPPAISVAIPWHLPFLWKSLIVGNAIMLACIAASSFPEGHRTARTQDGVDSLAWPSRRAFVNYGAPLGIWIGLASIYQNADRVMLSWLSSDTAAGQYSVLYDISNRGLLLPVVALGGAAGSVVLSMFNGGDRGDASRANWKVAHLQLIACAVLMLPVAVGIVFAGRTLDWFGPSQQIASVLVYLAGCVWALADTIQRHRMGTGHTLILLRWLAISAVGNVVANLFMIPWLGLAGAAAATLGSALFYMCAVTKDARMHPVPLRERAGYP